MSIDNRVTSKYFSKNSMDESLSDFKEAKQSCKGPKAVQKPSKNNPKKTKKHIKGQKDIRTALKGKKNELIKYSKEFDNVCKKAGVDVDSEQLQLAIALSKSLQTEPETTEKSVTLSSQERVGKIRTTLQEYGFKVPEIKITTNKRIRKPKKHYKLLLTTEAERSQVISEKYSKILFDNLESISHDSSKNNLISEASLFHISTNAVYESLKDDSIFYVNNLVEKSAKIGSLLRDWSSIPGRPISPKLLEVNTMEFSDIDCTQNELDTILSSTIRSAQSIINSKEIRKVKVDSNLPDIIVVDDEANNGISDYGNDEFNKSCQSFIGNEKLIQSKQAPSQYCRSCSPDLFDDEVSSILDITKNTNIPSQEYKTRVFTEDVMELTECANTLSHNSDKPSQSSQNLTKRKSNDYMEITECIVTSSQPILENGDNIDLTQSPDKQDTSLDSDGLGFKDKVPNNIVIDSMDLTQPSDNIDLTKSSKEITVLNAERKEFDSEADKSPKLNIDLTQSSNDEDKKAAELEYNTELANPKLDGMDLTQSSNSSDDLPFVQLTDKLEDTIILDENDYLDNGRVRCSILPNGKVTLDLTQEENQETVKGKNSGREGTSKSCEPSFYEEFVHDHSESVENDLNESGNDQNDSDLNDKANSDIDLTQGSESSREITNSNSNSVTPQKFSNSFGNEDDISTDYDDICNMTPKKTIVCDDDITEIKDIDNVDSNNDLNSSQNTEFEISDKELDYSLHKSRHDVHHNFEFGGISVLDDITKANHTNNKEDSIKINNKNNSISDSLLPEVNVKNNNSTCEISPSRSNNNVVSIVTPNNRDYIVKTDEVTPISDYASMTTPQRNRALDRYGLKPLKRKRAIQLLTHLYNQTHPIIEPYSSEEQPSPSKKRKEEKPISPKKLLKSPNKSIPRNNDSPMENIDIERGIDVCSYEVTSEVPDVKSIECSTEDWVFQKREKAKVHSCRVPLHIAFHNYVSSRRELREAILKYEPVNIDVIHKELVGYGHRYDSKDLLKFLDKKCITVKTTDNNTRNNKI